MGFVDSYIKEADTPEARLNLNSFSSRFGVELEFLSPISLAEFHRELVSVLGVDLVRERVGGYGTGDYTRWSVTTDSSIHVTATTPPAPRGSSWCGIELISPAFLSASSDCEKQLELVFSLLHRIGAVTNVSCGLHISSSCSGISGGNFKPFVFCALAEDMTLLRQFDRANNHYCSPTSSKALPLVSFGGSNRSHSQRSASRPSIGTTPARDALSRPAQRLTSLNGKYHSVNVSKLDHRQQDRRIVEYRGLGGDYLSTLSSDQLVGIARRLGISLIHSVHADIDTTISSVVSRYYTRLSCRLGEPARLKTRKSIPVVVRNLGNLGILRLFCGVSIRNGAEQMNFKFVLDTNQGNRVFGLLDGYSSPLRTLTSSDLARINWMRAPDTELQVTMLAMLHEFFSSPSFTATIKPLFYKARDKDPKSLRHHALALRAFAMNNRAYIDSLSPYLDKPGYIPDNTFIIDSSFAARAYLNSAIIHNSPVFYTRASLSSFLRKKPAIGIMPRMDSGLARCYDIGKFLLYWLVHYIRSKPTTDHFNYESFASYISSEAPGRLTDVMGHSSSDHIRLVSGLIEVCNNTDLGYRASSLDAGTVNSASLLARYADTGVWGSPDLEQAEAISRVLLDRQYDLITVYVEAIASNCGWDVQSQPTSVTASASQIRNRSPLGAAIFRLATCNLSSAFVP